MYCIIPQRETNSLPMSLDSITYFSLYKKRAARLLFAGSAPYDLSIYGLDDTLGQHCLRNLDKACDIGPGQKIVFHIII